MRKKSYIHRRMSKKEPKYVKGELKILGWKHTSSNVKKVKKLHNYSLAYLRAVKKYR